jgi:VIT1/CCC1 family predicted Fe2+/Mn2+ transporter
MNVISSQIVTNRTICDYSLTAITGTLTCDVSSLVNNSAMVDVKIFVDGVQQIQDSLYFENSSNSTGGLIFFGFLFILIIGIFFIESKEGTIIATILGFIVLIALGVVKGKVIGITSGVIWLIVVGIILLIKLNGEKQ